MKRLISLLFALGMVLSAQIPTPFLGFTAGNSDPSRCTPGVTPLHWNILSSVLKRCSATDTWTALADSTASTTVNGQTCTLGSTCTVVPAAAAVTPAMLHASTFDVQTDASTVTWAIGSVLNAQATLTFTVHSGNRTLNITNPAIGGNYLLKLIQDSTGGEGLLLGTGCTWKVAGGGSGAVTLTNAPAALDLLRFTYDGTNCLAALTSNLN